MPVTGALCCVLLRPVMGSVRASCDPHCARLRSFLTKLEMLANSPAAYARHLDRRVHPNLQLREGQSGDWRSEWESAGLAAPNAEHQKPSCSTVLFNCRMRSRWRVTESSPLSAALSKSESVSIAFGRRLASLARSVSVEDWDSACGSGRVVGLCAATSL